jgi:hypothetical protein
MAREEIALHRIERNINAIEEEVAQMRHSLETYASNPKKYEPQRSWSDDTAIRCARQASRHPSAVPWDSIETV